MPRLQRNLAQRLLSTGIGTKQTRSVTLEFGEWLPDQPVTGNPGLVAARNVYPIAGGYSPFPDLAVETNALEGTALGAVSAQDSSGNVFVYAGTSSKLYELVDATWTDESIGGGYTVGTDDRWNFAIWDPTQQVFATNFGDAVQEITIGEGSTGAFAALITSTEKPKARSIAVVKNFLVLGNINSTADGVQPERVHWSASGEPTDFDPDAATLCDFQDLDSGGPVQGLVGGAEYGVIFQLSLIRRMDFAGVPTVFDLPAVDRQRGTSIPSSIVGYGRNVFYRAEDGFFRFNGSTSIPIGNEKLDRQFATEFDPTNKNAVSAAVDPVRKIVAWLFPGEGNSNNVPNKIFAYRWDLDRWAEIRLDATLLVRAQTQGFTLDGLDTISTDIDTGFTLSFDADFWKGGQQALSAFDTDHKFGSFSGSNLSATFETGEVRVFDGQTARVAAIRPITDAPTPQVAVAPRARTQDTLAFEADRNITAIGEGRVNAFGRFHQFKMTIPAGEEWTFARGIDVRARPGPVK